MHPLVAEVGKQCNYMGFFFAQKAHVFPGLFNQVHQIQNEQNRCMFDTFYWRKLQFPIDFD